MNDVKYLKDYKAPNYLIPKTDLTFKIHDDHTIVESKLVVTPNYTTKTSPKLVLDGENLELQSVYINGALLSPKRYKVTDLDLTLPALKEEAIISITVKINPKENKALEGLYCSKGMYCSQNEPEGFRHITYYVDRPDNMSLFTTRIEANYSELPVLLSNGNKIESGESSDGIRHAVWEDPFPKPSYLFALVAGDLAVVEDEFVTMSGRTIPLQIFVNHGNEDKCQHSLDSLKKAMKWDEDVFGLEYDLDLYMIVAVDDFNSGAMENKGLNIFNSSLSLAKTETATDSDYHRIEGVIAHEYFHNWTGNRVTCRDWFQLTLKEGLTVFRDQEFSSDTHSRAVQRINDVSDLISYQFAEDASKMSHPIQPSSYMEINNFYTSTVYEKGAEVIRMIQTIIGKDMFRKGMDKYFELNDGKAVTTEDFIKSMEIASGVDLNQFRNWYSQSCTPKVVAKSRYSALHNTFTISFKQSCDKADGYKNNKPFHIPIRFGLLGKDGHEIKFDSANINLSDGDCGYTFHLKKKTDKIVIENVMEKPVVSLLRGFSAPVILEHKYSDKELFHLAMNDSDTFNVRQACKVLLRNEIEKLIVFKAPLSRSVIKLFKSVLQREDFDNAFKVSCLALPSNAELLSRMEVCDYEGIKQAKKWFTNMVSNSCHKEFNRIFKQYKGDAFSQDDEAVGNRKIKNWALSYLMDGDNKDKFVKPTIDQMEDATNMTDEIVALALLSDLSTQEAIDMTDDFKSKWKDDFLVMNKWFAIMASSDRENAIDTIKEIAKSDLFDNKNPNSLRYLYGSFVANIQFHDISGNGYAFISDIIIEVDKFNHKIAAGLCKCFKNYYKMDEIRKMNMKGRMEGILANDPSKDVYEVISKTLS